MDDIIKIDKEKRKQIRISFVKPEVVEITLDYIFIKQFKITDMTKDGCFLEDDNLQLELNKVYNMYIKLPGDLGNLQINALVVRCNWTVNKKKNTKKGYGIKFILNKNEDKIMDSYVIFQRNKQIITVSKRIIEEFFGPKVPLI